MKKIPLAIAYFLCTLSITTLIWLLTLQATILNRQTTKTWLNQSSLYTQLIPQTIKTTGQQTLDTEKPTPTNVVITPSILQTALENTFPPSYIQNQTETIVDSTYNWLEGTSRDIIINIPIQDKKPLFTAELARAIQPSLASLPPCMNLVQMLDTAPCMPVGVDQAAFAQKIAETAVSESIFFNQPLTNTDLTGQSSDFGATPQQQHDFQTLSVLPMYRQWLSILLLILPVIAVTSTLAIILIAPDKLLALGRLCRRLAISAGLTLVAGLVLLYLGNHASSAIPGLADQPAAALFIPVLQQALTGIATQLAIISGTVAAITGLSWLTISLIRRRQQHTQPQAHSETQAPSQHPSAPKT